MGRRSQYFVKKKLQLKIFLMFACVAFFIMSMLGADVILIKNNFFLGEALINSPRVINVSMLFLVIGNVLIIIGFPLWFSHKIAGPMYRLEMEMDRIGKGNLSNNIKLRKGDFLKEIAVSLNSMQDSMKYRLGNIKKTVFDIYEQQYPHVPEGEKERLEYLKGLVDDLIITKVVPPVDESGEGVLGDAQNNVEEDAHEEESADKE